MASLIYGIRDGYNYIVDDLADPRTNNYLLIRSPWPVVAILVIYHNFVHKFGPAFMKNRKPFKLDRIIQIYNIAQVALCAWFSLELFIYIYGPTGAHGLQCHGVDRSTNPIALKEANFAWGYYMMKILDLMDTIFFVLRKKMSQVTFLHVYHHILMVLLTWFGVKYFPGGQGIFLVFINSIVHTFMYAYYFLSNYNPEYKKQIWWKKYLTQMQMIQFLVLFIQATSTLIDNECQFPKWPVYAFLPHDFAMLYLFAQFYRKTYWSTKTESINGGTEKAA